MGGFIERFELSILALFLCLPLLASAAPAPWYKWRSVATGDTVCAQTSPGNAWVRLDRTYVDPRCQRQDKAADSAKDQRRSK